MKNEHLKVYGDTSGAFVIVPLSQLTEIRELLDREQVRYFASDNAISFNDEPATVSINFLHGVDVQSLQAILDTVACS